MTRASGYRSTTACVCRKPYPCWWSEGIGYPGGTIALILFVLGILASPFKAKSRLEAENAAPPAAVDCFAAQGEESAEGWRTPTVGFSSSSTDGSRRS